MLTPQFLPRLAIGFSSRIKIYAGFGLFHEALDKSKPVPHLSARLAAEDDLE
jgi:hypothetical protein